MAYLNRQSWVVEILVPQSTRCSKEKMEFAKSAVQVASPLFCQNLRHNDLLCDPEMAKRSDEKKVEAIKKAISFFIIIKFNITVNFPSMSSAAITSTTNCNLLRK